jgi:hypothetical protein
LVAICARKAAFGHCLRSEAVARARSVRLRAYCCFRPEISLGNQTRIVSVGFAAVIWRPHLLRMRGYILVAMHEK